MEVKIKHGQKSQRELSSRTKKLKSEVKKLVLDYEAETGLVVTKLSVVADATYGLHTKDVSVDVALALFEDDDEG